MKKFFKIAAIIFAALTAVSMLSTFALEKAHDKKADLEVADTVSAVETFDESDNTDEIDVAGKIEAYVLKVIDGDTFYAYVEGRGDLKFRLIGVDTPESVHSDVSRNVPEGKVASDYTKSLLPVGGKVYLEYDVSPVDAYNRELVYVYLPSTGEMLNEILLREGYARTMTIAPNVTFADEFAKIQHAAELDGVGFWHDLSDLFAPETTAEN